MTSLSLVDVAARAGVPEEDVEHWARLGLLGSRSHRSDRFDSFDLAAVARARLVAVAIRRGLSPEAIASACSRDPRLLDRFAQLVGHPEDDPRTVEEAAAEAGLDPVFARRLRTAGGLALDDLHGGDVRAMRAIRAALDVGLPEEALLQLVRVLADALGRVADAEVRLFHFYVHERLRAEGLSNLQAADAAEEAAQALRGLIEPAIAYFHQKAWEVALREDMLAHFAEELAPDGPPGQLAIAVLFVDLAGFTPLTEAMGDAAAADVVDRFSQMVREEAVHCEGRVVKQIGDAFMLVFPNAESAVTYGMHLAGRAASEPHFPAVRMGANYGTALYREADYLGATVNIAARVAGQAERGQLVVTAALRGALSATLDVAMTALGQRELKGLGEPVTLHVIQLPEGSPASLVDPVCGMALDPEQPHLTAEWDGAAYAFCSEACRDRFVTDPARYR